MLMEYPQIGFRVDIYCKTIDVNPNLQIMKMAIIFLLTRFTTNLSVREEPEIKVTRVSSTTQIEAAKRQALQRYSINSEVQVIKRNDKGEITNLKYVRFD